jgi:hypothetical protein
LGIDEIREIDENVNRRKDSKKSYTFHGRDVYSYTAARLAAGVITFEQVGPLLPKQVVTIPYQQAVLDGKTVKGDIPVLDVQYGNVWTNIPKALFDQLHVAVGDAIRVRIFHQDRLIDDSVLPFQRTFGEVPIGQPLVYINSLMNVALALNQGSYAASHNVQSGLDWFVELRRE